MRAPPEGRARTRFGKKRLFLGSALERIADFGGDGARRGERLAERVRLVARNHQIDALERQG